jgi:hypothetical protein
MTQMAFQGEQDARGGSPCTTRNPRPRRLTCQGTGIASENPQFAEKRLADRHALGGVACVVHVDVQRKRLDLAAVLDPSGPPADVRRPGGAPSRLCLRSRSIKNWRAGSDSSVIISGYPGWTSVAARRAQPWTGSGSTVRLKSAPWSKPGSLLAAGVGVGVVALANTEQGLFFQPKLDQRWIASGGVCRQ